MKLFLSLTIKFFLGLCSLPASPPFFRDFLSPRLKKQPSYSASASILQHLPQKSTKMSQDPSASKIHFGPPKHLSASPGTPPGRTIPEMRARGKMNIRLYKIRWERSAESPWDLLLLPTSFPLRTNNHWNCRENRASPP